MFGFILDTGFMILPAVGRASSWRWFPRAGDKFIMLYLSVPHLEAILPPAVIFGNVIFGCHN